MSLLILSGRLAKWALLLSEFEINFVLQRAIKGQALANFLADHLVPAEWELTEEFHDEEIFLVEVLPPWEMYFDGAARRNESDAGVLFISPRKDMLPYSFVLTKNCSNNEAEYQAILLGLGMAVEMKMPQLTIYGDSALVIKQLIGEFEKHTVEFAVHTRPVRSSTYMSSRWATIGRRCSGTPPKWLKLADRANSTPITCTNRRSRFTQQSRPGRSKRGGWTSLVQSLLNQTPTGNTFGLPPTTSPNEPKLLSTEKSRLPQSLTSFGPKLSIDMGSHDT
ncbi:hypothetical protein H6P81_016202 [Aristolochia fimbriata]|uniref:RNase H type-1 domain-containing protein n=1 Tax=Aristolochia fimbriata TaxID=158543 RepID=A0AAV7E7N8_ARIFI|nr:hypothetical protein H6P81_016202 [Aristolochia fimbriata]